MNKRPSIQWYPADWLKDPAVQALDYEAQGIWFAMLMRMHEMPVRGLWSLDGKTPISDQDSARILGITTTLWQQTANKLSTKGVAKLQQNSNIIYNTRMLKEFELSIKRGDAGRASAQQRAQQKAAPSSSSSSSSSYNTLTPTPSLTKKSAQKPTAKTNPNPTDPLAEFPRLTKSFPKIVAKLLELHPGASDPSDPSTKIGLKSRQTLAQLVRLDRFSEEEVVATLQAAMLDESVWANGSSWREQIQSLASLRESKRQGEPHKFHKINKAYRKQIDEILAEQAAKNVDFVDVATKNDEKMVGENQDGTANP